MKRKHVSHVKYRRYFKRKRVVDLVIMSVALGLILIQLMMPEKQQALGYDVDIPEEAIRLRILAHSDDTVDQDMKRQVRDDVSRYVAGMMTDITSIEEARDAVTKALPEIEQVVGASLNEAAYPHAATVTYGKNIVFPTKVYDTRVYPQGEYEAVLVTIGDGEGKNWWCVLFPSLCFVDFNGDVTLDQSHTEPKDDQIERPSDNRETEDEINEASSEEDESETKPEAKFWLVEQISKLIHTFSG
ncbi:stage II sporulation protein R [Halolactibacillus miurensis]|uniref:Stage II sporulation protein R n=1 Tax=Halolactibacillus miurensis TaxID=306541 RepID=A0A1I6PZP4_9BACI|nr:stage II sporulation protein R [Halolactibacillus miurensis]GEM05353.1 stage II sporulation protein R [Halolactibacillus miurensis]SFS45644.1 stage II sporulation protein R [Halolactibacillus miurensis]